MRFKPNLALIHRPSEFEKDLFHHQRVQQDLTRLAEAPDFISECAERLHIRFRKAGERAVLGHWTALYQAADKLIAARNGMERKKTEYLQLAGEHDVKETQRRTVVAKLQADIEEHELRREKASYQRQHVEQFVEGANHSNLNGPEASENAHQFAEAYERRHLDARWELHESLRALNTLLELQRWRREQRDRILKDRLLSAQEQGEGLQFVDDLYEQKRADLRVDTRIFEEA